MSEVLPESFSLDISALSRLFDKTTNSYKLTFFQAILNLTQDKTEENRGSVILSLKDLTIEMVAISWYPHAFFKLSFGTQDKIGSMLSNLDFSVKEHVIAHASTQNRLRQAIQEQYSSIKLDKLLRFVPKRLLSPFFEAHLRGVSDHNRNNLIKDLSNTTYFSDTPPLYRFIEDGTKIEIHPKWVQYLRRNYPIIKGWVSQHWVTYLQSRNPNNPAILSKINPPLTRTSLKNQTEYWRSVIKISPVRCIYSGEILNPDQFALDHFIPWSYVCHNQLWNLVPVLPEANSSKNNRLPADKYQEYFVQLQNKGLSISKQGLTKAKWLRFTESFVSDLHVSYDDLIKPTVVERAFFDVVPAIISLAKQTGFKGDWEYF